MAVSIPQKSFVRPYLPVRADAGLLAPNIVEAFVQNHGARLWIEVDHKDATIGHVLTGI
jgi:hypothetical protein